MGLKLSGTPIGTVQTNGWQAEVAKISPDTITRVLAQCSTANINDFSHCNKTEDAEIDK